jgi:hypothetical protein
MEFWLFPEDVPEGFLETGETREALPPPPAKRSTFQLVHSAPPETEGESSATAVLAEDEVATRSNAPAQAEGETAKESEAEEPSRKPKATPSHLKLLH